MLIIGRAPGEKIRIGDDVTLAVIGVENNSVHLAVEAPAMLAIRPTPQDTVIPPRKLSIKRSRR